ncbi:suppressor of loss of ypt1 [Tulasnella sp. 403]|nr:suppressor of loss of ypt1 [Tulasnella sp. 403]
MATVASDSEMDRADPLVTVPLSSPYHPYLSDLVPHPEPLPSVLPLMTDRLTGVADTADESRWRGNGIAAVKAQLPWSSPKVPTSLSPKRHYVPNDLPSPITADRSPSRLYQLLTPFSSAPKPQLLPRRTTLRTHPPSNPTSPPLFSASMIRFIVLCALWYASSALSSNTGKQIMNQFKYPVTLTFVQFGFVSGYCLVFANPWYGFTRLRSPTWNILHNTLPMAFFQVGGHIFSSMAISRVPVSTVHTIKALSPLFTVAAYALLFGVRYSAATYLSLLPLTFGVMLACSFELNLNNAFGLICAFGSAIVFVTSNIFFKKIMPSAPPSGSSSAPSVTPGHKLDKLNLLFYSSGLAFLLMIPLFIWSDLFRLLEHEHHTPAKFGVAPPTHGVVYYFFLNGTVHWAQNIIAFAILSSTSPVTYSIASLIKRIAVILIAFAWFRQTMHPIQAFGILMTFTGLWMYNNAKADVERGENRMRRVEARMALALPLTKGEARAMDVTPLPSPQPEQEWPGMPAYSVTSAVQQQGSPYSNVMSPAHGRRTSFAAANLMAPPSKSPSMSPAYKGTLPQPYPSFSHPAAPPRLDTSSHHPAKPHHREPGQPMSPTDSYPSPPASNDSPPQTAMPTFGLAPTPNMGGASLFNRRPTIYESSSTATLDTIAGITESPREGPTEGLGVSVGGVPIAAS